MKSVHFNQFDGGMLNDPRTPALSACRVSTNFDLFTNPRRMSPYRSSESGDDAADTSQKQNFCVGLWGLTSAYRLFSLGVKSGASTAEVLMKDLTTTSDDLSDDTWLTPTNNQSSSGATSFDLFVYYKTTGLIYGARAGSHIWAFDPTNNADWNDSEASVSYTHVAQGLVHTSNDILYVPYDNKIASNNAGSWNTTALTLPSHLYITSLSEYGNYLAIGCAPLSGIGNSVVFLWNMDETVTTIDQNIDWGEGQLTALENIEGYLVGISLSGNSTTRNNSRVIFRVYESTAGATKFAELVSGLTINLRPQKQKIDNRLYFMMSLTLNGSIREGIWSIGRTPSGTFSIAHERTPNNDTALGNGVLESFYIVGDYAFISYINNDGDFALSKTITQATFSATSIYESLINPNMPATDRSARKKLGAVSMSFAPLTGNQQAVLKYRVDGGDWTTIFTKTASSPDADLCTYRTTNAQGTPFSQGTEYEFRIESTGGAEITEFAYGYDIIANAI